MQKEEMKRFARALIQEMGVIGNISLCDWVSEEKILQEIPFTKRQLELFRNNNTLEAGVHYKSLGMNKSKDGSRRGRKTILYHRNRMFQFIDGL